MMKDFIISATWRTGYCWVEQEIKFLTAEETFSSDTTEPVQQELERFLKETVLPGVPFQISLRWSGTMAVGKEKKPIVKKINDRVFCAVRMSGMGVALAPHLGKIVAGMMR